MSSSFPWCVSAFDHDPTQVAQWGQYRKTAQDESGEPKSGADFCLVLPRNDGNLRIAIFQAKKSKNFEFSFVDGNTRTIKRREGINLFQAGTENFKDDQLKKLRATAGRISGGEPDWVHYLAWRKPGKSTRCISLARIPDVSPEKNHPIPVDESDKWPPFVDLLVQGTSTPAGAGWHETHFDLIKDHIPDLLSITEMIIVDESGSGGALADYVRAQPGVLSSESAIQPIIPSPSTPAVTPIVTVNVHKLNGP